MQYSYSMGPHRWSIELEWALNAIIAQFLFPVLAVTASDQSESLVCFQTYLPVSSKHTSVWPSEWP